MINESLLTKLKIIFEIIKNNDFSKYIIPFILIITFFVILSCKMKDKFMKIFYIVIYISIIGFIGYQYHSELLSLIDYLIENIVANLLFPNLAIYIGVLLTIDIIVLITLFSKKIKPYVRNINIISFAIMQLFLYLIVDNIIANDVNVYEKLSIYTNQNLLVLVELSMQLFVVWIGVLGIIKLIDYLMSKTEKNLTNKNDLLLEEVYDEMFEEAFEEDEIEEEINYYADYMDDEIDEFVPIKKVR